MHLLLSAVQICEKQAYWLRHVSVRMGTPGLPVDGLARFDNGILTLSVDHIHVLLNHTKSTDTSCDLRTFLKTLHRLTVWI